MRRLKIYPILLVVFAVLITFSSCQQGFIDTDVSKRVVVEKDGLTVILKEGVPEDALELSLDDYKALMRSRSPRFIENEITMISFDEIAGISEDIIYEKEYPNLYEISDDDLLIILEDFPNLLTKEEVWNNIEKIREIYGQQGTYQLFNESITHASSRNYPYQPDNLSNEEYWLLLFNFWKISGTKKATDLAFQYEMNTYTKNGHRDKCDAFRHSIWNVLIAKYTDGNKMARVNWAKTFTDAHEHGHPAPVDNSLDNPMDYHNNAIGRNYWINHVTESGILWWYKINIPSDDAIIASIYSRAENAVYCTTTVQITNAVNDLVYIPFNVAYPAP